MCVVQFENERLITRYSRSKHAAPLFTQPYKFWARGVFVCVWCAIRDKYSALLFTHVYDTPPHMF